MAQLQVIHFNPSHRSFWTVPSIFKNTSVGSSWGSRIVLTMDCGDDFGKFWKFTKNHSIIHLKWMNFTIYKLFLNKAVFAKKKLIIIWVRIKELELQNTSDVTLSHTGDKRALKMLYALQPVA